MTEMEFRTIAGATGTRTYPATWLRHIVIEQLDPGILLSLIDKAIAANQTVLTEANRLGLVIDPDRTLVHDTADTGLKDRAFAAFDELALLRDVRTRLIGIIAAGSSGPDGNG